MKSQIVSKNNSGFSIRNSQGLTLIEILVVVGMVSLLFVVGSFADISSISRSSIMSEQATLVSVLQKARNMAMNNINASAHGVRIESNAFVLFTEPSSVEKEIPRNNNITHSGIDEVIFKQLSGNTDDAGTMVLTQEIQIREIEILENGLIKW